MWSVEGLLAQNYLSNNTFTVLLSALLAHKQWVKLPVP